MPTPGWLVEQAIDLLRTNRGWMSWNLALAVAPAILATLLFPSGGRRHAGWWVALVAFVLLLPNAPYVVTDIIHIGWNARAVGSGRVVLFVLLPMFAAFIVAGYLAYLVAMDRIVAEVRTLRPRVNRLAIELPVHAICALGIVLGRVARLNSWDTLASPRSTIERTFTALSWRGAPVVAVLVFVAVTVTYTAVRAAVIFTGHLADRVGASVARSA